MSFEYASDHDRMTDATFKKVIKEGNGVWTKPGHFFNLFKKVEAVRSPDEVFRRFAIDVGVGQRLIMVNGLVSWTGYGSRSKIPWLRAYVVDEYGVVTQYKLGGDGNLRVGWKPNPRKTEVVWERGSQYTIPQWLEDLQEDAPKSEEAKLKVPVASGKHTVTGTVLTVKEQETPYGYALKMLVETGGEGEQCRVWGTVPRKIDDVERGQRVRFTATFTPKEDGFGFFSRPSKPEILDNSD